LLKAAERRYGLIGGLAGCLEDKRQAGKVDHSLRELLAQSHRRGESGCARPGKSGEPSSGSRLNSDTAPVPYPTEPDQRTARSSDRSHQLQ
jgi:hypothetical protein